MTDVQITLKALKEQFNVVVELGKYAPGDGWTRYSVTINNWHDIKQGMTAKECQAYLQGVYDMLRVQWDESKQAKREQL
jgi:hypothetical protein